MFTHEGLIHQFGVDRRTVIGPGHGVFRFPVAHNRDITIGHHQLSRHRLVQMAEIMHAETKSHVRGRARQDQRSLDGTASIGHRQGRRGQGVLQIKP